MHFFISRFQYISLPFASHARLKYLYIYWCASLKNKFFFNRALNVSLWLQLVLLEVQRVRLYQLWESPSILPTSVQVAVPRDVSFSIQERGKQCESKTIYVSRPAFNRGEDPKRRDAISERRCRHSFRILTGAHVKPDTAVLGPTSRQETTHSVASPGLCFVNLDRTRR